MTVTAAEIRPIAIASPEVVEADHRVFPSFRGAGKIMCTLRVDPPRLMVKLTAKHQDSFVAAHAGAVTTAPGYWGRNGSTYAIYADLNQTLTVTVVGQASAAAAPRRLTPT
jgi:hypothetical protein